MALIDLTGTSTTTSYGHMIPNRLNEFRLNHRFSVIGGNLLTSSLLIQLGLDGSAETLTEGTGEFDMELAFEGLSHTGAEALAELQQVLDFLGDAMTLSEIEGELALALELSGTSEAYITTQHAIIHIEKDYADWIAVKAVYRRDIPVKGVIG